MQGTCPHDPSLADQRPAPRTEPTTTEIQPAHARADASQQDTTQAADEPGLRTEVGELMLLGMFILGAVALASALL